MLVGKHVRYTLIDSVTNVSISCEIRMDLTLILLPIGADSAVRYTSSPRSGLERAVQTVS